MWSDIKKFEFGVQELIILWYSNIILDLLDRFYVLKILSKIRKIR
jgi:hypothetical protein